MVDEAFTSRVAPNPPPSSKRAKSSAPSSSAPGSSRQGSAGPLEVELGDAPPSSQIDVSSPPRDRTSTATRAEASVPSYVGAVDPPSYPDSGVPPVSMLRNLSLAKGKLCDFVGGAEAQEVAARGPEGMVDTALEGFALVRPFFV